MCSVTEGFGLGLWQWRNRLRVALGFWLHLWKGAKHQYSPIEKQLYAVLLVLQHGSRSPARKVPVTIRTSLPIAGWTQDTLQTIHPGITQKLTLNGMLIYHSGARLQAALSVRKCMLSWDP